MEGKDLSDILADFSESQGNNAYLFRNRPYKGQPHTDQGERGKQEVHGLTMRDLMDCFVVGACRASGDQLHGELYDSALIGRVTANDLYRLDWNALDCMAVWQNMSCEIERMMGIFPNVPSLKVVDNPLEKPE